jgi:hypothetical protein
LHETSPETKLKLPTRTTDNPFENDSIFLNIDSRATERKKGNKPESNRINIGEDEDPEIQREIDRYGEQNIHIIK